MAPWEYTFVELNGGVYGMAMTQTPWDPEDWEGYCLRCGDGVSCGDADPPETEREAVCYTCDLAIAREEGAAVAFGLIGMAEAIRGPAVVLGTRVRVLGGSNRGQEGVVEKVCRGGTYGIEGPRYAVDDDQLFYAERHEFEVLA